MGLSDIIRSGVAIAAGVVSDLMVDVTHSPYTGTNEYNEHTYGSPATRRAIVENHQRLVRTPGGEEQLSVASLTFLGDIALDVRDKMVLPDGSLAPLLAITGLDDPQTNRGYVTVAYIGSTIGI